MKFSISLSALILVAMTGCSTDFAMDAESHSPATAHAVAARASLSTLRILVASPAPKSRGFESVAEVDQSDIGEPFPLLLLSTAELRNYEGHNDARAMLRDVNEWFYPIEVSGQVRTAVRMGLRNGAWVPGVFGYAWVAKAAVAMREQLRATGHSGDLALVYVPALSRWLISYDDNGSPMLTPLRSDEAAGLIAGQSEPATASLTKLAQLARNRVSDL